MAGGKDSYAHSIEDLGYIVLAGIYAQAGLGYPLETGDDALTVGTVLQCDVYGLLGTLFLYFIALDVAFIKQYLGDSLLDGGSGNAYFVVLGGSAYQRWDQL